MMKQRSYWVMCSPLSEDIKIFVILNLNHPPSPLISPHSRI